MPPQVDRAQGLPFALSDRASMEIELEERLENYPRSG